MRKKILHFVQNDKGAFGTTRSVRNDKGATDCVWGDCAKGRLGTSFGTTRDNLSF
ncbi:MAG: hypothetical protein K2L67_00265 [Clostridia bacterium]|nr:hypothetical protein [Clostridia bacterium]